MIYANATKMAVLRLIETIEAENQVDIAKLSLDWEAETGTVKITAYRKTTPEFINLKIELPGEPKPLNPLDYLNNRSFGYPPTPKLPEGRGCVRDESESETRAKWSPDWTLLPCPPNEEADMTLGEALASGFLQDHGHPAGDCCDEPDCYQAWEMYPDG